MALGASKDDILRPVLGHGLRLTLIGLALGLAAWFALTRYLKGMLLGVTSTDAVTFSGVAILLCAVSLFTSFIPARRAMHVNPMVAPAPPVKPQDPRDVRDRHWSDSLARAGEA